VIPGGGGTAGSWLGSIVAPEGACADMMVDAKDRTYSANLRKTCQMRESKTRQRPAETVNAATTVMSHGKAREMACNYRP
jgi:hypothetical protein